MTKSPDAFRTISEVAEWLGVQAHVLRFWESKFNQIKPVKRAGGRRYYRPADMLLIGGIKKLLHEDGMTIKGVQKLLREQGVDEVSALSQPLDEMALAVTPRVVTTVDAPAPRRPEPAPAPQAIATETPAAEPPEADADGPLFARRAPDPEPAEIPEPEPDAHAPAATPGADLPSFMRRDPAPESAAVPEAPQSPEPDPTPRPRIVDAPDTPPDAPAPADGGLLTRLARVRTLSPAQAVQLVPLVKDLRRIVGRETRSHG
jgi:DNA-binding transcriptional MerR regulator